MRALLTVLLILAAFANAVVGSPYVMVLGVGQDAGVPQMGCDSPFCRRAWTDARLRQWVSSVALVDPSTKGRWIFDATPDLPDQFEFLQKATGDRTKFLSGIFLTHAHMGHYTGLMYLGRESMNSSAVPVFAMPRMKQMLEDNAPWSQLAGLRNIDLKPLTAGQKVELTSSLSVEPFLVPHRDEFSETVGYRISSQTRSLIFIPDIDKWEKWRTKLEDVVRSADHVLVDGTFYADGEISRPMNDVPHPFVTETMRLLGALPREERAKVHFIHFNHSNPLVQGDRRATRQVLAAGFGIAKLGQRFTLK